MRKTDCSLYSCKLKSNKGHQGGTKTKSLKQTKIEVQNSGVVVESLILLQAESLILLQAEFVENYQLSS